MGSKATIIRSTPAKRVRLDVQTAKITDPIDIRKGLCGLYLLMAHNKSGAMNAEKQ